MADDTNKSPDDHPGETHFSTLATQAMICLIVFLGGIILYQQYQLGMALDMINMLSAHVQK